MAWKNPSGEEADVLPGLQEPKISVYDEEEEAREHDGGEADANVKNKEEDKYNVEMVSVEEELKHSSSNPWVCGNP